MQATVSSNGFGFGRFGRFGGSLAVVGLAAAFAAGIATGYVGQTVLDDTTGSTGAALAIVQPKAYYSAGQGEGLLSTNGGVAALKAHHVEGMGEGRLSGTAASVAALTAHTSTGQGEGILGGNAGRDILTVPVVAYSAAGMGEGWLTQGRPQAAIQAHAADGQGEGWVGNGRP